LDFEVYLADLNQLIERFSPGWPVNLLGQLFGGMDLKGMKSPLFFILRREHGANSAAMPSKRLDTANEVCNGEGKQPELVVLRRLNVS